MFGVINGLYVAQHEWAAALLRVTHVNTHNVWFHAVSSVFSHSLQGNIYIYIYIVQEVEHEYYNKSNVVRLLVCEHLIANNEMRLS